MPSKDSDQKKIKKLRDNHVLLGLSGGNGSALAAALLKSQGFDVTAVHFILGTSKGAQFPANCTKAGMQARAKKKAAQLGIDYFEVDLREEFDFHVVDYSVHCYLQRKFPYPCIPCNGSVKLHHLYEEAQKKGMRWIATGHFAQVNLSNGAEAGADSFQVKKALSEEVDQSFEFFTVEPKILSSLMTPLGNLPLSKLEKLAIQLEFIQAGEEFESTRPSPCFSRQPGYTDFIDSRSAPTLRAGGVMRTVDGRVLGDHIGLHHYELGQIGFFGRDKKALERLAVVGYDEPTPGLVLGDEQYLMMREFLLLRVQWLKKPEDFIRGFTAEVRAHPQGKMIPCQVTVFENDAVRLTFKEPVRILASGSPLAIYDRDELLGGGWLERGDKLPAT